MIVWLNGTFGCGKTTTTRAILALEGTARLWDPEFVGYMLRPLLTDLPVHNFQDWPAWREIVVATGHALYRQTGQALIAPQSVLNASYMREIKDGFRARHVGFFEVLLDAPEEALAERIAKDTVESDNVRAWRREHLPLWVAERARMQREADLVIDTILSSPQEAALTILRATLNVEG